MTDVIADDGFPILNQHRKIRLNPELFEKLLYARHVKGVGNRADICNKALDEFFQKQFEELNIERFESDIDQKRKEEEESQRLREREKAKEDRRLILRARELVIKEAIEKVKKQEAKTGKKPAPTMKELLPLWYDKGRRI